MGLSSYFFTLAGRQQVSTFLIRRVKWISVCLLLGALIWLAVLPFDDFNIPTRISENALMPGQVQTHFGGSDYKVLNAFRNEIRLWQLHPDDGARIAGIEGIFRNAGMKSMTQKYNLTLGSRTQAGTNIYGLLEAPRGDATEALVLNAAWQNNRGEINEGGVTQLLALARYFRRWSLWSKDIIFVVPADRDYGSQAWLDAYHETHDTRYVESLLLKAGAIQAGVDIDWYGQDNRFDEIDIRYQGNNGQLCNLDLVNSAIHIAKHQLGIMTWIQGVKADDYFSRLLMMFRALASQAHGLPTGSFSPYIPYKIDTISIQVHGKADGQHDDSALGRVVESIFRTLNNILEHLHASFFFYILVSTHRFVSIGTYLPSAMLIAIGFTLTGLSEYVKITNLSTEKGKLSISFIKPIIVVIGAHILGLILFSLIRICVSSSSNYPLYFFSILEYGISLLVPSYVSPYLSSTDSSIVHAFSQLILGMFLSAVATINFPLSLAIGILCFPMSFLGRTTRVRSIVVRVGLLVTGPSSLLFILSAFSGLEWTDVIRDAIFKYSHMHIWTPLTVFLVWWPIYLSSMIVVA